MAKRSKTKKGGAKFRFRPLDLACIAVGVVASVVSVVVDHEHAAIYIIASLFALNCGVMEMVLGVRGRRSTYIFGGLNAVFSMMIAWMDQFYGNMIINAYYIPLSITGFYLWSKHSDRDKNVIARKLSLGQIILVIIVFVTCSVVLNIILENVGGQATILDSMATILIIFASVLGVLRYREQWLVWIGADILMFMMWVDTGNIAILTMRGFYLLASAYGYINWRKLIKKTE